MQRLDYAAIRPSARGSDLVIKEGGIIVMGETTEIIGAEHLVAEKAVSRIPGKIIFLRGAV